jgi:Mg-chelatase subunit ChlD
MKLADQPDLHPDAGAMTTLRPLTALMARQTTRETVFDEPPPQQTASLRPLTTRETHKGPFLGPQEAFSMLLVVDTSGSVKGPPLWGIKKSAMEFVNLLGEMDRCAVITFDDKASLVVPFISDTTRLREEIDRLQPQGRNTVLFDALSHAFTLLRKEKKQRRFVVLFSDGKDEGSQLTFQQVIKKARESHIAVFCLGYSRIEKRYLRTLENISHETGGIFAEAPHFGEIVELLRTARASRVKNKS